MAESKNIWMWAAAALLCTTIGASYFALNYQSQNTRLQADYEALLEDVDGLTITIDMMIDYGDDNVVWLNDTRVPLDVNLLKALELLADIEYTTSEFGAFVTLVDGVGDDPPKYWLWFYYDLLLLRFLYWFEFCALLHTATKYEKRKEKMYDYSCSNKSHVNYSLQDTGHFSPEFILTLSH